MRTNIILSYSLVVLLLEAALSVRAAAEPIAVIVSKANAESELTKSQLARVYRGELSRWTDGQNITALNRPLDSDVRRRFYRVVLDAEPTAKSFVSGSPIPFTTALVQSDKAARKMVASNPTAISYLPLGEVDDTVKVLKIDGVLPGQAGYQLE